MTVEGPRVIQKTFDATDIDMGEPTAFPATTNGHNWEILDNAANPTFACRSYYDLSGFNLAELTTFFQGVEIQEGWGPRGTEDFIIVDMLTTEYLDNQTLINAAVYTTQDGDLPGFPRSTFDMRQVVYGRTREFTAASPQVIAQQYSTSLWGTCAAASSDKIYLTRVVYLDQAAAPASKVHIPPANYVTAAIVAKEKDLAYLMRQKRSYEQSNTG